MKHYHVETVTGSGMSLDTLQMRDTVRLVVKHTDGETAWQGRVYYASYAQGRVMNGIQLQARNMARRLEAYLARTGKRWEVEHRLAREAKQEEARAQRHALELARKHAPELLTMLCKMTAAAHRQGANGSLQGLADEAAELIAKATPTK